jgi:GNAT superfamily N-acetyltransferase
MKLIRLPHDAATEAQVRQYYDTRGRQLLHDGYRWSGHLAWAPGFEGEVYETSFDRRFGTEPYASYFALPHARGKGHLRKLVALGKPIVTLPDCHIEDALRHVGASYELAGQLTESVEYKLIQAEYGDKRTDRSRVFLMNHIDEGLGVMAEVDASTIAMRAFCLHPLLQDDESLAKNFKRVAAEVLTQPDGAAVMALAMEYRSVANEYLAHCAMRAGGIRLSPLKDVNDMLIGDKVQNRKDFEQYHAETHENRARLTEYFAQWCEALGVADRYDELKALLPA